MKIIMWLPSLEIGLLPAIVLLERNNNHLVVLCQDRVQVVMKDGDVWRPAPESQSIDLWVI